MREGGKLLPLAFQYWIFMVSLIPYIFKSSHWLKLQHSDWRANLVKDFFLQINFPPMRALEFVRDHVTFKLWCNQI